jgi:C4-dicarboxylate-specific signal transduction histidine kinase
MVVPQENRENMKQLHDDFLAFKKEEIGQEFQVLRKNGKLIHIYASAGILEDIVGGPYKITTISDISELVQAREVQKEQERMLVQQSKLAAVGEMIGNIAHQWRQPLNVINCTTLDIKLKKDMHQMNDDFMERSLQNIEKLTEQMSETINDFMNFYKPDKKKSLFNLYDSIMNVYKIIATQLLQEQISFSLNIDKDIQIYGTKNELQQIILNIFSNSKDAFANQKINNKQLSIYYTKKDNRSHLCIEDNAGGIEPELLEKIFLPYFTTKEEMNGTGIGLYMSAMIASNSFSGTLSAQNITNNNKRIGVRFILDFPIKKDL